MYLTFWLHQGHMFFFFKIKLRKYIMIRLQNVKTDTDIAI